MTAAPPQVLHFVVRRGGARAKVATGSALNGDNTCLQRTRKSRAHYRLGGRGILSPGYHATWWGLWGAPWTVRHDWYQAALWGCCVMLMFQGVSFRVVP